MTPNVNYFDQIEDYCSNQLDAGAKVEFEAELKLDAELRKEVKLRIEIQSAIEELDVTNLRDKLKNVITQNKSTNMQKDSFDLLKDFSDFEEIHEELSSEDLINFFDSMPKVHVHQHEMTTNENIHQFYKEQEECEILDELDDLDDLEFEEFEGLEDAILEKDIIDFRQKLTQVAKSVEPQFTVEEIDNFLNDELDGEDLAEFEKELSLNSELSDEVKLHAELEDAVTENDIIDLRGQMSQIMETETSWNVSERDIEDYIDGVLDESLMAEFNEELNQNSDLMAEVELRRQVNEVIGESDIQNLREGLKQAQKSTETNKVRLMVPDTSSRLFTAIKSSVAVAVVVLGIASLLNSGYISNNSAYNNYYESPGWSAERSISSEITYLQKAQVAFMEEDFNKVVELKEMAPTAVQNYPVLQFYTGASLQNMNKFQKAAEEYSQVIKHADNMYIEEAEWYRSLCYMKLGNKEKAQQELLAIVNRNGHYKKDAKAILRRLRFSLE